MSGFASDHNGKVTLTGVSIPGATVTAKQGEKSVATITDQNGVYRFTDLADGVWTMTVAMVGFETLTREVTLPSSAEGVWELTLLPIEQIVGVLPAPRPEPVQTSSASGSSTARGQQQAKANATPAAQTGFQRAGVKQVATPPPAPPAADEPPADPNASAAGLLINGSVNNGAASPFAQARAFGTNRPNQRSLYSYASGLQLGNSAWDARPYSFTSNDTVRPSYTDAQFLGTSFSATRAHPITTRIPSPPWYRRRSSASATSRIRSTRRACRSTSSIRPRGCHFRATESTPRGSARRPRRCCRTTRRQTPTAASTTRRRSSPRRGPTAAMRV
jgi:hypothetical protein